MSSKRGRRAREHQAADRTHPELPITTPDDPVPKFPGEANQVVFIEKTLGRFEAELGIGIESLRNVIVWLEGLGPSYDAKDDAPQNREADLIGRCEIAIDLLSEAARALRGRQSAAGSDSSTGHAEADTR